MGTKNDLRFSQLSSAFDKQNFLQSSPQRLIQKKVARNEYARLLFHKTLSCCLEKKYEETIAKITDCKKIFKFKTINETKAARTN